MADQTFGELLREAKRAAQLALDVLGRHDDDPIEQYERIAAQFHRETGHLRPGKDSAPAAHADEVRARVVWAEWCAAKGLEARKALADFLAKVGAL
jgi:hypothetical protein